MKNLKKAISFAILFLYILTSNAFAEEVTIKRIQGSNRIETSVKVSQEAFKTSKTAIIVGYNGEVDALTGTILAKEKNAPILMSNKKRLTDGLKNELKRLKTEEVYILGGTSSVEDRVREELENLGLKVKRINGDSREETAINIAKEAITRDINEAFLSLGYGVYADALAIGPVAASKNVPLLLSHKDKISKSTIEYLQEMDIKNVNIIGGKNAITSKVEGKLEDLGIEVTRIQGSSREETAIKIAKTYVKEAEKIIIANGYKYADAVVGGYLSSMENAPILLTSDKNLKDINKDYISEKQMDTILLGGQTSIGNNVFEAIKVELGLLEGINPSIDPSKPGIIETIEDLKLAMKEEFKANNENFTLEFPRGLTPKDIEEINTISKDGSYETSSVRFNYRYATGEGPIDIEFNVEYQNTIEEEAFIEKEINRIVKTIIKPGMNDFQKVRAVNDYIVNNTRYSEDTVKTPHSPYALLKEGKGVCQAYAITAYRLLDKLGIENYYLTGDANNGSGDVLHAWNLVNVDGEYYHLDTTWNDPVMSDGSDASIYDYLLISEETISKDHKMDKNNFPKAVSKKYEVFRGVTNPMDYKDDIYFSTNDDFKIYSISLKTLKRRKVSDINAPYSVLSDGRIYFSNYEDLGYIYSMNLKGKDLKRLNSYHSTNLKLEYPYIKFFNESHKKWERLKIK